MINELTNLDSLLDQYDPGTILIGPLRKLSINSTFRYFHVAGKGTKVYESVGLGFVELETNALKQRADLLEKLNRRFGKVIVLDSHLELAQAVYQLWPNQETARVLAAAKFEAKGQPANLAGQNVEVHDLADGLAEAGAQHLVEEMDREPVAYARANELSLTPTPPSTRYEAQPSPAFQAAERLANGTQQLVEEIDCKPTYYGDRNEPAVSPMPPRVNSEAQPTPPLQPAPMQLADATASLQVSGNDAVVRQGRQSELDQFEFALAALGLQPSEISAENRPVEGQRSSVSIVFRFCALAAVAASLVWILAPLGAGNWAMPAALSSWWIAIIRNNDPSHAGPATAMSAASNRVSKPQDRSPLSPSPYVAAPTLPAQPTTSQPASAEAPAAPVATAVSAPVQPSSRSEAASGEALAAPVAAPQSTPIQILPPSQAASAQVPAPLAAESRPQSAQGVRPSQLASARATAGPDSSPKSASAPADATIARLDTGEITRLVGGANDFLKSGDLASARLLLRRATELGDAHAALLLGATFDPVFMQELGAIGINPDIAQARQWYETAAKLGSDVAKERIARLAKIAQ
jgi:hypothetical protein